MEKYLSLVKLGLKYLSRYRRRYIFLLAALVFCFAIITFISSEKDGMYDSVYYSAQSHYSGDIIAIGYNAYSRRFLGKTEIAAILDAADIAGINPRYTVLRTFGLMSAVYFNGARIELKYLQGCDWENETHIFARMSFTSPFDFSVGDDGIILSAPSAAQLSAGIGDMVMVETDTIYGYKNTGNFIVRGIMQDSSIFGYYKAFISRTSLNSLLLYGEEDCSTIGFFLDNPAMAEQKRLDLYNALNGKIQTGPLVYNRDQLDMEEDLVWEGTKTFLLTLPVYLSEISDLLDALNTIAYFLYAMMLLIILVSAVVTYRLILHERTKEMGIMRTIGFFGTDLRTVLWTEIIALGIASLLCGFLLAKFLTWVLSLLSFSWFPSFEIFMKNGRLTAMFLPGTVFVNVISIFLILLVAAFFPGLRASRKNLPGLLSGEPL